MDNQRVNNESPRTGNLEKFSHTLLAHAIAAHADSQTKAMARAKPAHH
ncbi:MAG: hypothetical protein ACK5YS_05510 [bacterium]